MKTTTRCAILILFLSAQVCAQIKTQANAARRLSGVIVTDKNESVAGASVVVRYPSGEQKALSDANGNFLFTVPSEPLVLRVEGKNLNPFEKPIAL